MLHRTLALPLNRATQLGEPVLLQGPRSAGKTTLVQREFPGHSYVTLDAAADRVRARSDPSGFLAHLRGPAIVDDAHRAPELIEYLRTPGLFAPLIVVSSRRVRLPFKTLHLYPPTRAELQQRSPMRLEMLGRFVPARAQPVPATAPWPIRRGFIENDIRDLVSVHDPDRFETFLASARAASGNVLDQQGIGITAGITHTSAARWLNALDTCFQLLRLPPADMHFGRRVVRSPKLHFLVSDCFESQVISEIFRNSMHENDLPDLRYWRDSNGLEVPLVIQFSGGDAMPVGILSPGSPAEVSRLRRWMELAGVSRGALIGQARVSATGGGICRYSIEQL